MKPGDDAGSKLIYLKGLLIHFSWETLVLLAFAIWASARLYYFMFYVIEKYVDPEFKFSSVYSFVRYLLKRPKS
jgi:hypothetical protein